jgi:hypothetical protein
VAALSTFTGAVANRLNKNAVHFTRDLREARLASSIMCYYHSRHLDFALRVATLQRLHVLLYFQQKLNFWQTRHLLQPKLAGGKK